MDMYCLMLSEAFHQIFAHKLWAVVGDDGLRDAKSSNDVPPYEAFYVRLSYGHHRLCFYPFSEVVGCHNYHASAPSNKQHRSYQVDCPLHEQPRTRLRIARWQAVLVPTCNVGSDHTFVLTT
ncbi:hypothetical protein ACFX2I_034975 [Malus domestica]